MICINELTDQKCNNREIISDFAILLSSYAPHISEEIWSRLGNQQSITTASFPKWNEIIWLKMKLIILFHLMARHALPFLFLSNDKGRS